MARSAKIYDFTIPANGSFTLLVEGSYYRILSSSGALEVKRNGGSGVGPIYAGQGERDEEFKRITLVDKTGAINSGYIIISDGTFVDDRITGEVSVIDGELSRSKSGASFISTGAVSGVAAQYSYHELWNPVGSGKRVIVSDYIHSSNVSTVCVIQRSNALLSAAASAINKSSVGGASVAKVGTGNTAAIPGVGIELFYTNQYLPVIRNFKQPVICEPGSGFLLMTGIVNNAQYSTIQFTEEPV